jgi:hypothetical protein
VSFENTTTRLRFVIKSQSIARGVDWRKCYIHPFRVAPVVDWVVYNDFRPSITEVMVSVNEPIDRITSTEVTGLVRAFGTCALYQSGTASRTLALIFKTSYVSLANYEVPELELQRSIIRTRSILHPACVNGSIPWSPSAEIDLITISTTNPFSLNIKYAFGSDPGYDETSFPTPGNIIALPRFFFTLLTSLLADLLTPVTQFFQALAFHIPNVLIYSVLLGLIALFALRAIASAHCNSIEQTALTHAAIIEHAAQRHGETIVDGFLSATRSLSQNIEHISHEHTRRMIGGFEAAGIKLDRRLDDLSVRHTERQGRALTAAMQAVETWKTSQPQPAWVGRGHSPLAIGYPEHRLHEIRIAERERRTAKIGLSAAMIGTVGTMAAACTVM